MTKDEWSDLKKYCDKLKLPFFATVAFEDEIDFIKEIGCESVKIASADVNFYDLIKNEFFLGKNQKIVWNFNENPYYMYNKINENLPE